LKEVLLLTIFSQKFSVIHVSMMPIFRSIKLDFIVDFILREKYIVDYTRRFLFLVNQS
jgi:hypothetical protein